MKKIELKLKVLSPPEATDFCNLLGRVICSLELESAQMIARHVHFVVMPIKYADGIIIPMKAPLDVAIVFITPPPKPPLIVIAHELAHFLCMHHMRGIYKGGSFPASENPQFEMEADKKSKEIIKNFGEKCT